jgi:hypothetical protein
MSLITSQFVSMQHYIGLMGYPKMNNPRPTIFFSVLLSILGACVFADSTMVAISDTNILNGLSPLNWIRKSTYIASTIGGASLNVGFTGTSKVTLMIDTKTIATKVASRFPILAWSVNLGAVQSHQLVQGETSVLLASALSNPTIDFYLKGLSPFENRYAGDLPVNAVKITGFVIDAGGSTKPLTLPSKLWMTIGNSIESGDGATYASGQGRPPDDGWAASDDGRASYGYLLANHYGYRESRLAYGGYNWGGGGSGLPKLTVLLDSITSTVSRLTDGFFSPKPDVVLITLGENGVPAAIDVTNALAKLRLRTGAATQIVVMVPVSGRARTEVTNAFNAYKQSTQDSHLSLVDLGTIAFATADGQHPTAAGHRTIYNLALPTFDKIISQTSLVLAPREPARPQIKASDIWDMKGRKNIPFFKNHK